MPFTFNQYQPSSPNEFPFNDILGKLLGAYGQTQQAHYLQPNLQAALEKAQLYNKYYGPEKESEIGLRGAQAGHLGSLTAGQNITNKYLPQTLEGQILANKLKSQKELQTQALLQQLLSGGGRPNPQQSNDQQIPNYNPGEANAPYLAGNNSETEQQIPFSQSSNNAEQQNIAQPATNQGQGGFSGLNYPQASAIAHILGFGQPHIVDVNGKQVAISPFGNFDTGVQGLNEQEKARAAGLGRYEAKLYGDYNDAYKGFQSQGTALDELTDAVENNEQFRNVTGPIKKPLANLFGSPEQKQLLGRLQSASGEIALQVAPSIKGAFTGRDQTLINQIKASPNDFADVFIGKLKAQKLINNVLSDRSRIAAELLEKGYKPTRAIQIATMATPLDKYRQDIKELTKHKNILPPDELAKARAELEKRKAK